MNKWEKEVLGYLLDSEEETIIDLEKQYKEALKEINNKVKAFQAEIDLLDAALESEGLNDKAKEILKTQRRSKAYQKQFQESLQKQVAAILDNLQSQNYSTIEEYLKDTYNDAYVGSEYILAQQGIPMITPIDQAAVVKAVMTDSQISEGLYSALGVDVGKLKKTISAEITRGIASSLAYADIARNINNVSKAGLSNAKRIVRTEGHRIQQASWHDSAVNAKAHGADLVRKWSSVLDGKTRPVHRMLDGQIREVDEPFSAGGMTAMAPGYFGIAAQDCNCRCIARSIPRILADGGFVKMDNFTKEVRSFESPKDYEDFKKKYWSKENIDYMNYVDSLEKRYGTKDFGKLLGMMTDREYEHFKKLEDASPMWKKHIANKRKSDTIKAHKKAYTKIDAADIPSMDGRQFKKIKTNLEMRGIAVIQDEDGDAYLKEMNAEAMTLSDGSAVIFQSGRIPSASAAFEELIHVGQIQKRGVVSSEDILEYLNREIEAGEKLLEHRKAYMLTDLDVQSVEANLEYYYALKKGVNGDV